MFKTDEPWMDYRRQPGAIQVDFHYGGGRTIPYMEAMGRIENEALAAIKQAFKEGKRYVVLTHGSSTSRLGKMTARSVVRGLMRSKESTPYIIRKECIQFDSVFVAAIRPNPNPDASQSTES